MKQVKSDAVVLHRVNYRDYDRIFTVLTPGSGKVDLIAKGVRKPTSKLAGSLEIFSTTRITYILGRGEISTLISAQLIKHYANIVLNLDKSDWCYSVLKLLNNNTEQAADEQTYHLLVSTFEALNDPTISLEITKLWFNLHFLDFMGHRPNLAVKASSGTADQGEKYRFNLENMSFANDNAGRFTQNHIKLLRLAEGQNIDKLAKITNIEQWLNELNNLMKLLMVNNGYRIS